MPGNDVMAQSFLVLTAVTQHLISLWSPPPVRSYVTHCFDAFQNLNLGGDAHIAFNGDIAIALNRTVKLTSGGGILAIYGLFQASMIRRISR